MAFDEPRDRVKWVRTEMDSNHPSDRNGLLHHWTRDDPEGGSRIQRRGDASRLRARIFTAKIASALHGHLTHRPKIPEIPYTAKRTRNRLTHKKCWAKGCTSKEQRMFTFPSHERDCNSMLQWVEESGRKDLLQLPPQKLKLRIICGIHFETKYFLYKMLSTSVVLTCHY